MVLLLGVRRTASLVPNMWSLDTLRYDKLTELVHRWSAFPADGVEGAIQGVCAPFVCAMRGLIVKDTELDSLPEINTPYEDLIPEVPPYGIPPFEPGDPSDVVDLDPDILVQGDDGTWKDEDFIPGV